MNIVKEILKKIIPNKINKLCYLLNCLSYDQIASLSDSSNNSIISEKAKIYSKYTILYSKIDDYTYIAQNSIIRLTTIGKFCSIGANFICGWGVHPTNGISTSPMFYSTQKQNGISLSKTDKIEETKPITIGNDVFIGMNVTLLDGVRIGNGAIIGAGCIVSKDVPPYAIVAGNPMRIIRYRFDDNIINELQKIKWWNWNLDKLKSIEELFFNVDQFIDQFKESSND